MFDGKVADRILEDAVIVADRVCIDALRRGSGLLVRFAFQARSFNHSDIILAKLLHRFRALNRSRDRPAATSRGSGLDGCSDQYSVFNLHRHSMA